MRLLPLSIGCWPFFWCLLLMPHWKVHCLALTLDNDFSSSISTVSKLSSNSLSQPYGTSTYVDSQVYSSNPVFGRSRMFQSRTPVYASSSRNSNTYDTVLSSESNGAAATRKSRAYGSRNNFPRTMYSASSSSLASPSSSSSSSSFSPSSSSSSSSSSTTSGDTLSGNGMETSFVETTPVKTSYPTTYSHHYPYTSPMMHFNGANNMMQRSMGISGVPSSLMGMPGGIGAGGLMIGGTPYPIFIGIPYPPQLPSFPGYPPAYPGYAPAGFPGYPPPSPFYPPPGYPSYYRHYPYDSFDSSSGANAIIIRNRGRRYFRRGEGRFGNLRRRRRRRRRGGGRGSLSSLLGNNDYDDDSDLLDDTIVIKAANLFAKRDQDSSSRNAAAAAVSSLSHSNNNNNDLRRSSGLGLMQMSNNNNNMKSKLNVNQKKATSDLLSRLRAFQASQYSISS